MLLVLTLQPSEYLGAWLENKQNRLNSGHIDTVKSLLERGMDINARNASDETPLDKAAAKGNVDIVRLLIERGAEVDSRDKWGWTPLHASSRYNMGTSKSRRFFSITAQT